MIHPQTESDNESETTEISTDDLHEISNGLQNVELSNTDSPQLSLVHFDVALRNHGDASRLVIVADEHDQLTVEPRPSSGSYNRFHPRRGEDIHIRNVLKSLLLERHVENKTFVENLFAGNDDFVLTAGRLSQIVLKSNMTVLEGSLRRLISKNVQIDFVGLAPVMEAAIEVREEFRRLMNRKINEQEKQSIWIKLQVYNESLETWKQQRPADICEVVPRLVASEIVAPLDFSTKEGTAIFWTGFEHENSVVAKVFADCTLKVTIEMTNGGRFLDSVNIYKSPLAADGKSKFGDALFAAASERFATGVTGEVHCIIYAKPKDDSIYCTVERPILTRKGENNEITFIEYDCVNLTKPLAAVYRKALKMLETYGLQALSGVSPSSDNAKLSTALQQRRSDVQEWSSFSFFQTLAPSDHPNVSVGKLILRDIEAEAEYKTKVPSIAYNKVFVDEFILRFIGQLPEKRHFLEAVIASEYCKSQDVGLFYSPSVLSVLMTTRSCPRINEIVETVKEMCSHVAVDLNLASWEAIKHHPYAAEIVWLHRMKNCYNNIVAREKDLDTIRERFLALKISSVTPWNKNFIDRSTFKDYIDLALHNDGDAMKKLEQIIADEATPSQRRTWSESKNNNLDSVREEKKPEIENEIKKYLATVKTLDQLLENLKADKIAWSIQWPMFPSRDAKVAKQLQAKNDFEKNIRTP
jgi:hypothetical protein